MLGRNYGGKESFRKVEEELEERTVSCKLFHKVRVPVFDFILGRSVPFLWRRERAGADTVNRSLRYEGTTVETRDPLMSRVIGQRQELSFYDVKLANTA